MTEPVVDRDVAGVIESELRLLRPEVRRSPELVDRFLHPDFFEFGASGRSWDRPAMVAAIGAELTDGEVPSVAEMTGMRLAETVILLTYRTDRADRRARRSSIWRRTEDGSWRLCFHQGTPLGDAER
jgi:hypothetical protein